MAFACSEASPAARPEARRDVVNDAARPPNFDQPSDAATQLAPTVMPNPGQVPIRIPSDFIAADSGGYKLGVELTRELANMQPTQARSDPAGCSVMVGIVRDFRAADEPGGHPDFEVFDGKKPTTGLVSDALGADQKPVYASRCEAVYDKTLCPYGQMTTGRVQFDAWYHADSAQSRTFLLYLAFEANGAVYTFQSKAFFPLDGAGFGNMGGKRKHNFGFTTELHGTFRYRGGESFSFSGDDDVWVFIHGRLAIDLGGLHPPASATLDLDAAAARLGLVPGHDYALDLFHAERHSASSNFRVDTTIEFTDCGRTPPELF